MSKFEGKIASMAIPKVGNVLKVIILPILLLVSACSEPIPDEQQIKKNTELIIQAIENLDYDALEEHIDPSLRINSENKTIDLDKIKKLFALYRFRKMTVKIVSSGTEISLDRHNSSLATLETKVLITGSKGLLPKEGRLYKVKANWRLFDDEWKVVKVSWE